MSLLRENLTNFFCQVLFLQTTIFTDFFVVRFCCKWQTLSSLPFPSQIPKKKKKKRKRKWKRKEKEKKEKEKIGVFFTLIGHTIADKDFCRLMNTKNFFFHNFFLSFSLYFYTFSFFLSFLRLLTLKHFELSSKSKTLLIIFFYFILSFHLTVIDHFSISDFFYQIMILSSLGNARYPFTFNYFFLCLSQTLGYYTYCTL